MLDEVVLEITQGLVAEQLKVESDKCLAIVEVKAVGDAPTQYAEQFFNKIIAELSVEAVSECLHQTSNKLFLDLTAENFIFEQLLPTSIKKVAGETCRDSLLEALADELIGGVVDEVKVSLAKVAYTEGRQNKHRLQQTKLFSEWVDGFVDEALVELLVDELNRPNLETQADQALVHGCPKVDSKWLDEFYFS